MAQDPPPADLAEARAIIARQDEELERLRRQHADSTFAEELRQVLIRSALVAP